MHVEDTCGGCCKHWPAGALKPPQNPVPTVNMPMAPICSRNRKATRAGIDIQLAMCADDLMLQRISKLAVKDVPIYYIQNIQYTISNISNILCPIYPIYYIQTCCERRSNQQTCSSAACAGGSASCTCTVQLESSNTSCYSVVDCSLLLS